MPIALGGLCCALEKNLVRIQTLPFNSISLPGALRAQLWEEAAVDIGVTWPFQPLRQGHGFQVFAIDTVMCCPTWPGFGPRKRPQLKAELHSPFNEKIISIV